MEHSSQRMWLKLHYQSLQIRLDKITKCAGGNASAWVGDEGSYLIHLLISLASMIHFLKTRFQNVSVTSRPQPPQPCRCFLVVQLSDRVSLGGKKLKKKISYDQSHGLWDSQVKNLKNVERGRAFQSWNKCKLMLCCLFQVAPIAQLLVAASPGQPPRNLTFPTGFTVALLLYCKLAWNKIISYVSIPHIPHN